MLGNDTSFLLSSRQWTGIKKKYLKLKEEALPQKDSFYRKRIEQMKEKVSTFCVVDRLLQEKLS